MIPGFPCQYTTTADGYPIIIVDYPSKPLVVAEGLFDKLKLEEMMKRAGDIMKQFDIKIICNGKPF